jgi:two-component system, NtrC family, nitrogen regulation sensor histidine kinase NtrY
MIITVSEEDIKKRSILYRLGLVFAKWLQNDRIVRWFGLFLSVSAILSGITTYIVLTGTDPFSNKSHHVLPLIYFDVALMLLLAVIIAKRLVELWGQRRQKLVGSKLHVQIVLLFSLVSITPGIFVAIFSALFFNVGVQAWFSEPVRSALNEARVVAEAYLDEHSKAISHDAQVMIHELAPSINVYMGNADLLSDRLTQLTEYRGLNEAVIFDGKTQVLGRSYLTFALEFEKVLLTAFERAKAGEIVVFSNEDNSKVRALAQLDGATDTYLYIGKMVDQAVLQHLSNTRGAIAEYDHLDAAQSSIQITFVVFFSVVALLLLLAAVWAGLTVANLFVRPISRLIIASDEISKGNLDIQVTGEASINNELGHLEQAFNRMTKQLSSQRHDLIQANQQSDQRRQFMETILKRVSAGVISIDPKLRISLINQRAQEILLTTSHKDQLLKLEEVAPELIELINEFDPVREQTLSRQVTLTRRGVTRVLQVAVTLDHYKRKTSGFIITFDDITPLLQAQRKATWSDVARRIAHEIKNPLTPILLSAERLKRKYLKEIETDPATFQGCIDTIIRQVAHIGQLVGEFSSFARMPDPDLKLENLAKICRQSIVLHRQAHNKIHFIYKGPDDCPFICDAGQIEQVITNLLLNAIHAFESHSVSPEPPTILIRLHKKESSILQLSIEDNGPGFPEKNRERLVEPYFTTHAKGTGLGLAIVAKIIDDHHGKLELGDSSLGGARVTIEFLIMADK